MLRLMYDGNVDLLNEYFSGSYKVNVRQDAISLTELLLLLFFVNLLKDSGKIPNLNAFLVQVDSVLKRSALMKEMFIWRQYRTPTELYGLRPRSLSQLCEFREKMCQATYAKSDITGDLTVCLAFEPTIPVA